MSEFEGVLNTGQPWASSKRISIDDLRDAIHKVSRREYEACGATHPHVVNPRAEGYVLCANGCGTIVFVHQRNGKPKIHVPLKENERGEVR